MEESTVSFRARTHGAVENERLILLKTLCRRWETLEKHELEGSSQKQKWDLWQRITKEFNGHPSVTLVRTPLQVKTLFKNMKTKAKKYHVRVEDSRITGRIVEADPVSEILIRILAAQSKGTTNPIVESLRNDPAFSDPFLNDLESPQLDESFSSGMDQMVTSSENDAPNIKEEALDFDEDNFSTYEKETDKDFENLEENEEISPPPVAVTLQEDLSPSHVHTFGDISVTPIAADKNDIFHAEDISISSFAASKFPEIIEPKTSHQESDAPASDAQHSKRAFPSSHYSLSNNRLKQSRLSAQHSAATNGPNISLQPLPPLISQSKFTGCCCPDYHNDMLHMAQKEHQFRVSLLTQELATKKAEQKLREEETKIREEERQIKEEELQSLRDARLARNMEHQMKMKLLELECQAVESRVRQSERTNKWLFRNGSKEI